MKKPPREVFAGLNIKVPEKATVYAIDENHIQFYSERSDCLYLLDDIKLNTIQLTALRLQHGTEARVRLLDDHTP